MMPGFEKSSYCKKGDKLSKLRAIHGWHVVKVSQVTNQKKISSCHLSKDAVAGKERLLQIITPQVNDIVEKCGKTLKKFEQYARSKNLQYILFRT